MMLFVLLKKYFIYIFDNTKNEKQNIRIVVIII
jgi:hypothetical protein